VTDDETPSRRDSGMLMSDEDPQVRFGHIPVDTLLLRATLPTCDRRPSAAQLASACPALTIQGVPN
jgi:hypothetical protein